jgi:hypothetical protein
MNTDKTREALGTSVVRRYKANGLQGGFAIGLFTGVLLSGPYFFEWAVSQSLAVVFGIGAVCGAIGWIAPGIGAGTTAGGGMAPDGGYGTDMSTGGGSGGGGGDCAGGDAGGDCG